MRPQVLIAALSLVVCLLVWQLTRVAAVPSGAEVAGATYRLDSREARSAGAAELTPQVRSASLSFAPGTTAADAALVGQAIATVRPEAQMLVGLVDGLVDVQVGVPAGGHAGSSQRTGERYAVVLDLAGGMRAGGARGVARLVLHELGHVVDGALVPDALLERLDAGIPQAHGCQGVTGDGCADKEERFAESFAKWATGDIGVGVYLGYAVLPPWPTLDTWGAPLAALVAG